MVTKAKWISGEFIARKKGWQEGKWNLINYFLVKLSWNESRVSTFGIQFEAWIGYRINSSSRGELRGRFWWGSAKVGGIFAIAKSGFKTLFFTENFGRLQKAHIANWKVRVGKCFYDINSKNSFLSSRKTRKFNVASQKSFLLERRFLFTCRITNSCLGQWNPSFCFLISWE